MFPMDSFYRIIVCPVTPLLSPSSTYHVSLCLGSRVDLASNLDPVSSSLLIKSLSTSAKCLSGRVINAYRNYDSFCIERVLISTYLFGFLFSKVTWLAAKAFFFQKSYFCGSTFRTVWHCYGSFLQQLQQGAKEDAPISQEEEPFFFCFLIYIARAIFCV
jgi:hypothetical protein